MSQLAGLLTLVASGRTQQQEHQCLWNAVSARAVCTLLCYCRVSGVNWVLCTGFVVVGSFFTSGERSRKGDCLTCLDHSCRTALQRRVKFVRTLTSQKEIMAKRNFKHVQGKNNKTPTDIHSNGEKKNGHCFSNISKYFGISHSKVI